MKKRDFLKTMMAIVLIILIFSNGIEGSIKCEPLLLMDFHDGTIIYVDDDNTKGPWNGSIEHPYKSIQAGINAGDDGNTVYVFDGTYNEHLVINKSISLQGKNRETVIIDNSNFSNGLFISRDGVKICNVTLRHSKTGNSPSTCIKMYSNNSKVYHNTIEPSYSKGIYFSGNNNVFKENQITVYGWGITGTNYVVNNTIENNTISNEGDFGIYLTNPINNSIYGNTIINKMFGISLRFPSNNILKANRMINCGLNLELDVLRYMNDIDVSNTVNGKPIYHYLNKNNVKIPSDAGQVFLVNCRNCDISGLSIKNSTTGIQLFHSYHNNINNNIISNNWRGINLLSSHNNNISSNIIDDCQCGVYIDFSCSNNFSYNTIFNNGCGLEFHLYCSMNQIYYNYIYTNSIGFYLWGASCNNYVKMNIIWDNDLGVYIYQGSYSNSFFHNDFLNNSRVGNSKDYNTVFENYWDNGYPLGGNYWDDYTGTDMNGDNIGDTAYNISGGINKDHYPLMKTNHKKNIDIILCSGLGIEINIKKNDDMTLINARSQIKITSPLLLIGSSIIKTEMDISPDEYVKLNFFIIGFGKSIITVTINHYSWCFQTFIIGPFVIILD